MYINNEHKFVFVSMTKSGSSSINRLLNQTFGGVNYPNTKMVIPPCCSNHYAFTVSRNPYARMVSWWWSICKVDGDRYRHKAHLRKEGLSESLLDFLKLWEIKGGYAQARYLDVNEPMDQILKLENIEEDFNSLPFVHEHVEIPRVNVKNHPSWQELLDDESCEHISRVYAEDFKAFQYEMIE